MFFFLFFLHIYQCGKQKPFKAMRLVCFLPLYVVFVVEDPPFCEVPTYTHCGMVEQVVGLVEQCLMLNSCWLC